MYFFINFAELFNPSCHLFASVRMKVLDWCLLISHFAMIREDSKFGTVKRFHEKYYDYNTQKKQQISIKICNTPYIAYCNTLPLD